MFIHHADVLWSKQGNLADPAWCLEVAKRLKPECALGWKPEPDPLGRNPCALLISYLRQLPPHERTEKIGDKLHEIAEARRAEILRLRWWDVEPSKRHLEVLLRRADLPVGRQVGALPKTSEPISEKVETCEVVVLLMWKKSEVADHEPRRYAGASSTRPSWAFDKSAPGGWRFEIECEIFEHIKDAFDNWLASPLPPFPRHRA